MFWITLLIVHGLLAFALLGAITHQAVSLCWSGRNARFVASYAAVRACLFTNAVIALYLMTFFLGGWIYTNYRYTVRPVLEDLGQKAPVGIFEYKEHILSVALALLPAYWLMWHRVPLDQQRGTRRALTIFIAVSVWIGFLGGHIANNARGL